MFFLGALIGVAAGMLRTVLPSLGNWGMGIALVMVHANSEMAISFLLAESSVGGLGSIIGAAYTPNLSNPLIADLDIKDRVRVVDQAAVIYTLFKVMVCMGFLVLLLIGATSVKVNVWPWSKYVILFFLVPSCIKRVGLRRLLPYCLIMGLALGGALLSIRMAGTSPMYTYFMAVFVIGGILSGYRPIESDGSNDEVDYKWAFITGIMSNFLIGVPGSLLLDLEGDKEDAALYKESAMANGVGEGIGISLFLVGFGSRDALSSTIGLWLTDVTKYQAVACLLLIVITTIWYYAYFSQRIIYILESSIISGSSTGGRGLTLAIAVISCLIAGSPITLIGLSIIGVSLYKLMTVYEIESRTLSLVIGLIACLLIP